MDVYAEIRYTKKQQIGVGQGMNSKVYRAEDPQLGGTIAVKEIPLSRFGNTPHDSCQTATEICLAMPLYSRGSLTDRIVQRPLPLLELIRVGQGVLAGIGKIHTNSIIHFDVKPSNVLLETYDVPLVADFGQSRCIARNGVVNCPPMYQTALPPEVQNTGVGTLLCDIFQAG
jgi:serine/threonine protein kinase